MFKTRLNPTKPPAAHRTVLERVGAACRELRPIEQECWDKQQPNAQIRSILDQHGVLAIGVPAEEGGVGNDPLLVAMAAERIGREGLRPVRWFALHVASPSDKDNRGDHPTELVSLFDDISDSNFIYKLNLMLCLAAGGIGVHADCLETTAVFCVERIQGGDIAELPALIEQHVAQTACDLEATRAVTYAASQLKAEFDHHPHNKHLRLEAGTLVAEAYCFSTGSLARMFDRTRMLSCAGHPLLDCFPARHRAFAEQEFSLDEAARQVETQIARYYLFE